MTTPPAIAANTASRLGEPGCIAGRPAASDAPTPLSTRHRAKVTHIMPPPPAPPQRPDAAARRAPHAKGNPTIPKMTPEVTP